MPGPLTVSLRKTVRHARAVHVIAILALVAACADKHEANASAPTELQTTFLRNYAELAFASYSDSLRSATTLQSKVNAFVAQPSPSTLTIAREAWIDARRMYLQTEVFRFYDGPIDRVEMLINTWPIDESYVESLEGEPPTGLINDVARFPELSHSLLESLNAQLGETSISTGYHVVELLLWGRDESATGPGARSHLDYVDAAHAARRARYLTLSTELLIQHLEKVQGAWAPDNPGNYRARFLALLPREALALVIKGVGTLSGAELAGERLTVPYETKDQENEHSCFSDTTHLDLIGDVLGIQNVCLGRYQRLNGTTISGPGLCAVVTAVDPALGARLTQQIETSLTLARAVPPPFDQAILGADVAPGRQAIKALIHSLLTQTEELTRVGNVLKVSLPQLSSASAQVASQP